MDSKETHETNVNNCKKAGACERTWLSLSSQCSGERELVCGDNASGKTHRVSDNTHRTHTNTTEDNVRRRMDCTMGSKQAAHESVRLNVRCISASLYTEQIHPTFEQISSSSSQQDTPVSIECERMGKPNYGLSKLLSSMGVVSQAGKTRHYPYLRRCCYYYRTRVLDRCAPCWLPR